MSDFQPYNNQNPNQNPDPNLNNGESSYQPNPGYQQPQPPYTDQNQIPPQKRAPIEGGGGNFGGGNNNNKNNKTLMYILVGLGVLAIVPFLGMIGGDNSERASDVSSSRVEVSSSSRRNSSDDDESSSKKRSSTKPELTDEDETEEVEEPTEADDANSAASGIYVVQQGDNMYRIAVNNGITLGQLQALNPGVTEIYPGMELNV